MVTLTTTLVKGGACHHVPRVEAPQTVYLAACGRSKSMWKGSVRQQAALLVANPKVQLLIFQASTRLVWAGTIPGHIVAIAEQRCAH